jgi:hypothetical protein
MPVWSFEVARETKPMPRPSTGPANVAPPLRCEQLEDRSLLSVNPPSFVLPETADAGPAEPCRALSIEGLAPTNVGTLLIGYYEEEYLDDSWTGDEAYWDEWYSEDDLYYEDDWYTEDWYAEDEYYEDEWYYEEEYWDDSWYVEDEYYPDEVYIDDSWYVDEIGWDWSVAWELGGPVTLDDGVIELAATAAGGIPIMAPITLPTPDDTTELAPASAPEIDVIAEPLLLLPPTAPTDEPATTGEAVAVEDEPAEDVAEPALPEPSESIDEFAAPALPAAGDPDDHIADAGSLELTGDLPVG